MDDNDHLKREKEHAVLCYWIMLQKLLLLKLQLLLLQLYGMSNHGCHGDGISRVIVEWLCGHDRWMVIDQKLENLSKS